MSDLLQSVGGELGLVMLARAFHVRLGLDPELAARIGDDFPAEESDALADHWVGVLSDAGGDPSGADAGSAALPATLAAIRAGAEADPALPGRTLVCLGLALGDAGIAEDDPVHVVLRERTAADLIG